jgi:hypothetical protein
MNFVFRAMPFAHRVMSSVILAVSFAATGRERKLDVAGTAAAAAVAKVMVQSGIQRSDGRPTAGQR